ncbi:hypothetical protein GDO86_015079 [Hymenochirus boettgeri]|uniref:PIH1D1/2/3 CS-like domain-containing protein n=1 Tax=Hymenochirus boettgeri TaxID=247094 RepID=A0A8T2JW43_9PIPI|nr:hypothetical protein GDO86_015079 [Hymenochirus boettgeri]
MELPLSEFSSAGSLEALCSLLYPSIEEDVEESSCRGPPSSATVGPGNIGPSLSPEPSTVPSTENMIDKKSIWNDFEVTEGAEFDDTLDLREQPKYEILFKQQIGTEDMFLGMTRKDTSTACCDQMVIRIQLPGIKASEVSLQVRNRYLDLRTPQHKLGLHLPHPVDAKNGKAKFVSDTETLDVCLTMVRDLDFINFF